MPPSLRKGRPPEGELGNGESQPYSETTPLLTGPSDARLIPENTDEDEANGASTIKDIDKPLDKVQIFVLCYGALVDPISFFCIVPFINQMIFETGNLPMKEVGYYSGLIVSRENHQQCFQF
jgi:hypothetical protein